MDIIRESLKVIILSVAAILLVGIAYAWTEPTVLPPNPNPGTASPLTTSAVAQTKAGNLTINALGVSNTASNALTVVGGAIFGGVVKIGSDSVATCSLASAGSMRYNSAGNSMELCDGLMWKSFYAVSTSTSTGSGNFTCDADKCVATCAADNSVVTLGRNQSRFCTTTGTATSNVWGTSGGYLNASINKKNSGWINAPVNYSVICNFFERGSWVYMLNCRDNYGTAVPWSANLSAGIFADMCYTYRNYTNGPNHADVDFSNVNCTSRGNATTLVNTNNSCTGPTTRIYCREATDTSNTKYQVRNNVALNFGSFPANWSSVNTNF